MTDNQQNNSEKTPLSSGSNKASPGRQAGGVNKKSNPDLLKWIIFGLAVFAVIILIFGTGIFIGSMKARFSYRWAESYHKNFAGPRGGFFGDWRRLPFPAGDLLESHGSFGEIIKINNPSTATGSGQVADLVVKGQGDVEKVIIFTTDTIIEKGTETIKKEELKIGDRIVVIGSPNEQGQIQAKLIRLFDGEKVKDLPKRSGFPFFR